MHNNRFTILYDQIKAVIAIPIIFLSFSSLVYANTQVKEGYFVHPTLSKILKVPTKKINIQASRLYYNFKSKESRLIHPILTLENQNHCIWQITAMKAKTQKKSILTFYQDVKLWHKKEKNCPHDFLLMTYSLHFNLKTHVVSTKELVKITQDNQKITSQSLSMELDTGKIVLKKMIGS